MSPSPVHSGKKRGTIIAIGGAEKKAPGATIIQYFVDLCGGRRGKIAVIPTASELRDTGKRYEQLFKSSGIGAAESIQVRYRDDCESEKNLKILEGADGIFITGGNQLRLSTVLGGTAIAKSLRKLNAQGVHIAGTSAGAAFIPEHMIATGGHGPSPKAGMVTMAPGLGLTNKVVIDQHFRQRDRLGRLLTALAYNPFAVALGVDEDTASIITADNIVEVLGSGSVTVVDPGSLHASSIDFAKRREAVCILGMKLHVLVEGATFSLDTRVPTAPERQPVDDAAS